MGECHNVSCSAEGTKRCSRCGQVTYCGAECQAICWKAHRKICKKSAAHGMKMLSILARAGGVLVPWSPMIPHLRVEGVSEMLDCDAVVYGELHPETNEVLRIALSLEYRDLWRRECVDSDKKYVPIVNYGDFLGHVFGDGHDPDYNFATPSLELKAEASALLRLMGLAPDDFDAEESIVVILTAMKSALCIIDKQGEKNIPRSDEELRESLAHI